MSTRFRIRPSSMSVTFARACFATIKHLNANKFLDELAGFIWKTWPTDVDQKFPWCTDNLPGKISHFSLAPRKREMPWESLRLFGEIFPSSQQSSQQSSTKSSAMKFWNPINFWCASWFWNPINFWCASWFEWPSSRYCKLYGTLGNSKVSCQS